MSLFALLILTLGILKNEVRCELLGNISKSDGSLLPRAMRVLPSHWTRLKLEFPTGNKVVVNTTSRIERAGNTTSNRKGKFFPKFSILAGLDIGGGTPSPATNNLTSLAKISQASTLPGIINPYFAASYDPYPSSNVMQQSIQSLYRLVTRLTQQVDQFSKHLDDSAVPTNAVLKSGNINTDLVDDRKRRKDKVKIKKTTPKKKKEETVKGEEDEDEVTHVDTEKATQIVEIFHKVKSGSRNGIRKNHNAKQVISTTTDSGMGTVMETITTDSVSMNSTSANTTMEQGNATYPQNPGYYYGGSPQNIGNVGFTYNWPQQSDGPPSDSYGLPSSNYGPPSVNYGPPSSNYGPPSTSYGTPLYSYGTSSQSYGLPSYNYDSPSRGYGPPFHQSYETAHYTSFHDHEPVIYEDPSENSFGPAPSVRWQQRLPFARSRNLGTTAHVPIANSNGFVPI